MKVSDLIKEIQDKAEQKFGTPEDRRWHYNDCINVGIYFGTNCPIGNANMVDEWQVWLERPTQKQLDAGVVTCLETCKQLESEHRFWASGSTLMSALYELRFLVDGLPCWENG